MKFYERAEIGRETERVFQAERNSSGNRFSFIVFGLRDWADKSGEDSAITCATSNLRIGAKRKRKIKLTWFLIDSIWKSRKVLNLRNGNLVFWEKLLESGCRQWRFVTPKANNRRLAKAGMLSCSVVWKVDCSQWRGCDCRHDDEVGSHDYEGGSD